MSISIIHPSRSRPQKAYDTMIHWVNNASKPTAIEYILSLDMTDPHLEEYQRLFEHDCITTISDNKNLVQATNNAAKLTSGEIIVLVSDDFECFKDWDLVLIGAFALNHCCVLKTFDGVQKWIVTLPIMDRAYYLEQGYFYHPDFQHLFCDTDMTHKADIEGKLLMRNDILFKHAHYSTGACEKDQVSIKADSTWAQGEAVYLKRVKDKFGLSGVDVFDLDEEGAPHRNWLKQKLRK